MGWGRYFIRQCSRIQLGGGGGGKDWVGPVLPHPRSLLEIFSQMYLYTVGLGKNLAGQFIWIFFANVLVYSWGGEDILFVSVFVSVLVYSLGGGGRTGLAQFFPTLDHYWIFILTRFLYTVGVGKNWAGPVLPHPRSLLDILFANVLIHSSGGEELGRPSSSPPRSLLEIFFANVLVYSWGGEAQFFPTLDHYWIFYLSMFSYTVVVGKDWAGPVLPHLRSLLDILFANVLVYS